MVGIAYIFRTVQNHLPGICSLLIILENMIIYRLFCYTIIGFSNKFISILLDDNPHNIATRKSRLRARINNSDCRNKDQLLEFLQ